MKALKDNELRTTRNDDSSYTVTTPDGRQVGGIVKWYLTDQVNQTGIPQFRHPWGDSPSLAKAVTQFEQIPWVASALGR